MLHWQQFSKNCRRRKYGGNIIIKMKWMTSILTKSSLFIVFNDGFACEPSWSIHILLASNHCTRDISVFSFCSVHLPLSLSLLAGKTSSIWRSSSTATFRGSGSHRRRSSSRAMWRECSGSHRWRRRTHLQCCSLSSYLLSCGSLTATRSSPMKSSCSWHCKRQWPARMLTCMSWGGWRWHGSWRILDLWVLEVLRHADVGVAREKVKKSAHDSNMLLKHGYVINGFFQNNR